MGNSRIHYVTSGPNAECGTPWKGRRRTRQPERATCDGCRNGVEARRAAEKVPPEFRAAYHHAKGDAGHLAESVALLRERAAGLGRTVEAEALGGLEARVADIVRELQALAAEVEA